MHIEVAGGTHVGMKRAHNEDSFLLLPEENLCVVADGMGGHANGALASRTAVETIEAFFRETCGSDATAWPCPVDENRPLHENRLVASIRQAHTRIVELAAREPRHDGMGTTLVAMLLAGGSVWLGWAGDSRAYRLRAGSLVQLSDDHSLVNDLVKSRRLTAAEAELHPLKNVVLRALGRDPVEVEVARDAPQPGDLYLLCSDGLSGMVSDRRIEAILRRAGSLERAVQQLIDTANAAGGTDNVTAVLARVAG